MGINNRVRGVTKKKRVSFFVKRVVNTLTNTTNIHAVFCFCLTLKATSSLLQFWKKLPSEILRLTLPIGRSFRYRDGAVLAVPSQPAKEDFISYGWPEESVFVIGQPRLDLIFRKAFNRDEPLSKLGIPKDRNMVLLATQPLLSFWNRKDHKEFVAAIVTSTDNFSDEELVIKLHPEEHIEDYQAILKEIGRENIVLCKDVDIYDLINACSLLMTVHSTTAMEAIILHKPVLCIDFTGRCPIEVYTESGAAIGVKQKEELVPAIRRSLYDRQTNEQLEQGRKRFLKEHIYKPDGQTSQRVAELIIHLAREARAPQNPGGNT